MRLDFKFPLDWKIGQHFYLCFTQGSIWQSHPFTPLNHPVERNGVVQHSYIFRAKKGETKKIAQLAKNANPDELCATPVVMQGPYGEDHTLHLCPDINVLCVAGGTGITYVLPVLLWLASQVPNPDRRITLIWAVRRRRDIEWVRRELDIISHAKKHGIDIKLYVTREDSTDACSDCISHGPDKQVGDSSSASSANGACEINVEAQAEEHPQLLSLVPSVLQNNIRGRSIVYASGRSVASAVRESPIKVR